MGCLFGAFLVKSGEDVLLLDRRRERAASISRNGLKVEGISGELHAPVRASADPNDAKNADLMVICVKSYDTEQAIARIKGVLGKNTYVLTLQNGVGNVEAISVLVGEEKAIGGVTSQGATLLGDGHIRHAGKGDTVIGMVDKRYRTEKLEEIAATFTKAGFETKIVDSIQDLIWSKLIINVGINALTAITRLNNGRLIEFEGTDAILEEAVNEAIRVAEAKGIKLIFDNPVEKVRGVCKATAGNIASMLQDVLKKRKTEIDYINGAIVKEANRLNLQVPVNKVLTHLARTIEASYHLQIFKS
jgi:2-dehydropantoate 2-reductase